MGQADDSGSDNGYIGVLIGHFSLQIRVGVLLFGAEFRCSATLQVQPP